MVIPPIHDVIKEERKRMRGRTKDEILSLIELEARGPKSKKVLQEVVEYESPAQMYFHFFDCPPVIERGKGATVWDVDGNEYIDLISGLSVLNVGHCHPRVVEAAKEQCDRLIHYAGLPNEIRTKLAKKLVEMTPGNHKKKVCYSTTGGEAVEIGMRFARHYTGRPLIMAFYGAYHGVTYGTLNVTSSAYLRYFERSQLGMGVIHVPHAYCYRCFFGKEYPDCDMQCTKFIEDHFKCNQFGVRYEGPGFSINRASAFLVEPMTGATGYFLPPTEFLQDLRRIADTYDMLLICDEIQTGWGRTGKWWGCEHSQIVPDILATGKAIAGGFPLSAAITRSEIMDELGPSYISTFGGSPLSCAVALAVIEVFKEEKLIDRAAEIGKYFLSGLNDLAEEHPTIGNVSGVGLYMGIELVKDQKSKEPAVEETRIVQRECLKRNLLHETAGWYNNMVKIMCPLVIEKEQVDTAIEILDEALNVAEKQM